MELVNVSFLGNPQAGQTYSSRDKSLITTTVVNTSFGQPEDYIEYFIYDLNNQLLYRNYSNLDFTVGSNTNPTNGLTAEITLSPETDVKNAGYDRGSTVIEYNFLRKSLSSEIARQFWIKEISTSRREIKAARQDLSNSQLSTAFDAFSAALSSNSYYPDFYLNFGDNEQVIGVNVAYLEEDGVGYVLFKLYEPLPVEYDVKSQFWVVQRVAETVRYQVDIQVEAEQVVEQFTLRGPNYDIDLNQAVAQTTPYYNYGTLLSTNITSSLQQLRSYLDDEAISINVDYSDFSNFIHFSSITERLNNFVYKLGLIEQYEASIASLESLVPGQSTTALVNTSKASIQQNINNIITKFDPYEYYLYYSSASTAWPKSNNIQPYTLYSVTSSQAYAWLGSATTEPSQAGMSMLYSASLYDDLNSNGLRYTAPGYIRDDEANQPYLVFLDMIGQHFDNVWLYYKDVTNRYSADNSPNSGISLDLVGEALKGFGMQLYTNTNLSDNIYYSLFGVNDTGSALPLTSSAYATINLASSSLEPLAGEPYLTQSIYLPPFGGEKLDRYVTVFTTPSAGVTASFDQIAPTQLEQEIYKRLYHNLPYLLKTKGTERGVRALIACYGIPNSILTLNEFGGYNMFSQGDILGIQDNKIYTGNVTELSDKLLSPFVTIQEYSNNFERNSPNVEIGFSPADSINADITGSLPGLNVQQLIGNPQLQYSSSYIPLQEVADAYFKANYTKGYNVWDFIRLIKFYNNSLFKMLKDFVPARTSLSSGIIVKPHILERNKYARHEPVVTTSSLGGDVRMVSISGSDPDEIRYSTANTTRVQTLSGSVDIQNVYSAEKYTGEFGGSYLQITNGEAFNQSDYSISPTGAGIVGSVNYGALFQNVTASVKSTRFFDLDYSTNQIIPVNLGLITQSIDAGQAALQNQYAPYAQLQDYNYAIRRSLLPRYEGSKTYSKLYNTYTGELYATSSLYDSSAAALLSSTLGYYTNKALIGVTQIYSLIAGGITQTNYSINSATGTVTFVAGTTSPITIVFKAMTYSGDSSYGKTAAIDRKSIKAAWVKSIPSQSLNFYDKTIVNLKYLVDADSNLTELNKRNYNLFDVQNIFKSGDPVIVSISDLEKPSYQKTLDGQKNIFRGGFSYDPIIFRENNELLTFRHDTPISQSVEYFGLKAFCNDTHGYKTDADNPLCSNSPNNTASPEGRAGRDYYWYLFNGRITTRLFRETGDIRMAYKQCKPSEWKYNYVGGITGYPANISTDSFGIAQNPNSNVDTGRLRPYVFAFNLLTFKDTNPPGYIKETSSTETYSDIPDLINSIGQTQRYYKVPRDSTYRLKGRIKFGFGATDGNGGQAAFRVVGIVEKSKTPLQESSWDYVANTTLEYIDGKYGTVNYNKNDNVILFDNAAGANYSCVLNTSNIQLQRDYYLRFQFYLIQYTNMFGVEVVSQQNSPIGVNNMEFTIGTSTTDNNTNPENVNNTTFFEIIDTDTANTTYYYTSSYGQLPPLFDRSGSSNDTIIFSESSSYLFTTGSTFFEGTGETRKNYTPVIDPFSIQKYDLLRLGKFDELTARYYEVVDVREDNTNPSKPRKVAVLNTPITGSLISQNFAVLRPKPDETSVILNYRKQPGDVSPSMLLPFDLNDEVKDNIGNIFKDLNPNLQ